MKKISIIMLTLVVCLFIAGCGKKEEAKKTITCDEVGATTTYTFEKGKLVAYTTSIITDKNETFTEAIKNVNEQYLNSTTTNADAIKVIEDVVKEAGGSCKK